MQLLAISIPMTMVVRRSTSGIAVSALCFCLVNLTGAETNFSCPGPIAYYETLGCTPILTNASSQCPERYDCDFLNNIPADKCYVNGHFYNIGENLRDEDADPCDIGCTCLSTDFGVAKFVCAEVDCDFEPAPLGCYRKNSPFQCCPGEFVCPEKPEDRVTCVFDGKTYKDGDYFEVPGEPKKLCACQPGYKGENIEPFCAVRKHLHCAPLFRDATEVRNNCAPLYDRNVSPATGCYAFSRCQNKDDVVIASTDNSSKQTDPDMMCKFGNLTMRVGDELNQGTDYSSVCIKCVCEVPPVPTCRRLPEDGCDYTKQAFLNGS